MRQIAATSLHCCCDKALRLFGRCDMSQKLNQFEFVRQITATKFCPRDNEFHISHEAICCRKLSQRRIAAMCRIVCLSFRSRSQSFYISVKCCSCFTCERLWLVTRVREAMVRPVTSPDPAWRSSGSLESAEPVWKKKKPRTFKGLSTLKPSTLCRLFLRLGLPSTVICHENGARSSNRRDLKTPAFRFRMEGKIF